MLDGFSVIAVSSIHEAEQHLRSSEFVSQQLDFVLLDDQSETRADDLARVLRTLPYPSLRDTKIIHLFTPTTDNLAGAPMLRNDMETVPGIVRMTKPPRQLKLLQTLAGLKNVLDQVPTKPIVNASELREEEALAQRTLFGNVLVAEDNPVAQKLLVKQLERYDLNVIATSNGEEAIAGMCYVLFTQVHVSHLVIEWERHEPGYFSVALFDHRRLFFFIHYLISLTFHAQICPYVTVWKLANDYASWKENVKCRSYCLVSSYEAMMRHKSP